MYARSATRKIFRIFGFITGCLSALAVGIALASVLTMSAPPGGNRFSSLLASGLLEHSPIVATLMWLSFVGLAYTLGWTVVRVLGWFVLGIMPRRDYRDAVELGEVTVERSCTSEIKPSHEPEKPDSADTTTHEVEQHDADVPALKHVVGGPWVCGQ